jgi:hypothetical protein
VTISPRLSDLRWLWCKVRRRFAHARHDRRVRARYAASVPAVKPSTPALPWSPGSTPPGAQQALASWRTALSRLSPQADAAARHEVAILSPAPYSIDLQPPQDGTAIEGAGEIDADLRRAYRRIDWHRDFRSGHRWDPGVLYLDVRVAPVPGADIKTPRELSRFQHIAPLAALAEGRGAQEFLLQVLDWIDANPRGYGVNWACTMDVALRAIGWIWGLRLFEPILAGRFPRALTLVAASLEAHGAHIEDNLEYYEESTGNHYLSNVAGLVYIAAAFPEFEHADRWLLFGAQELVSEMSREVYADGGAHEASTHYHRLVAELFVSGAALIERLPPERRARLARVDRRAHRVRPHLRAPASSGLNLAPTGALLPATFHAKLARMADFTATLMKPHHRVPQFGDNDSARAHRLLDPDADVRDHCHLLASIGELEGREDLRERGAAAALEGCLVAGGIRAPGATHGTAPAPQARIIHLPNSGIAVARAARAWLALTCGPNGQGGRGGHGHNDNNSFELNVDGHDFVVDGGCPFYSSAPDIRNAFRATAAHNTLSVDGQEQDRWLPGVGGLFRLEERSSPRLRIEGETIVGSHRGFGAVHERRVTVEAARLLIDDWLDVSATRYIHFNFDPAVRVEHLQELPGEVRCELVHASGTRLRMSIQRATAPELRDGHFGTGFGCRVANRALRARLTDAGARTLIEWSGS